MGRREDPGEFRRQTTMKNKSIHIAAVAAAVFVPLALFLHTFSA
jgi:hypothetical protein